MLHEHALVVSRHHKHLLHSAVEHCLDLRTLRSSDVQSVVCRKFKILEYRMVLLSELSDHRAVYWPWKLALVGREFRRKSDCSRVILLNSLGTGRGFRPARLRYDSGDFLVERLYLLLLGLKLLFVLLPILLQLSDHICRSRFVLTQSFKLLDSLRLDFFRILLQLRQTSLFHLQLLLHLPDPDSLFLHSCGEITEISEAPICLSKVVTCKDVHIPHPRVPILISTLHQT